MGEGQPSPIVWGLVFWVCGMLVSVCKCPRYTSFCITTKRLCFAFRIITIFSPLPLSLFLFLSPLQAFPTL